MFQCYESFRTPKTGRASTNLYLQLKWDLTDYENHRFNVRTAKSSIDNGAPLTYSHLYYRPKKLQLELERFCSIQRNNKYLMEKVARIQREGAWVDNKNYHEIKSLNIWKRQKEMIELAYSNQTMLNRLLDCTSYYNRSKLEDEYLLNQKYKANVRRYPKDWRNILQQIKLIQKMIKNKVISERTGKYIPGLERRKNKWALEREAFEIEKAQKAVQEAIEMEEKEREAQKTNLDAVEKRRKHKKKYEETSKKWREAREERLRLAKQREQETIERETEKKRQMSVKLRQQREKVKQELEMKREEKAKKAEREALEKKKRESEEYHQGSEKMRQRRQKARQELEEWKRQKKARQELEEWKRQKKAREAKLEELEKKEDKSKSKTERSTTLKQRRAQPKSKTKRYFSKELEMSDENRKKVQGERKPSKKGKKDNQFTINVREKIEDYENKIRKEAEFKKLGMRLERRKSSKEEEGEEEESKGSQISGESRKKLLEESRPSRKGKEDNKFSINGKGHTEDLENKMRKEAELKKLGMRTERRQSSKEEEEVMKMSRDIRESVVDKRRHTLDRSLVEEVGMKPTGKVSIGKEKEIDESALDSDSQDLTDDYGLEAPEARERSKDSKTLEDELKELQISEEQRRKLRIDEEELLNEREKPKSDVQLGERASEKIKIKSDERKILDEIAEDPKSETNRHELTEQGRYQIRDTMEKLPEIPKKSRDSIIDKDQPLSKSPESRSDEIVKDPKSETNRHELTEEGRYQIRDTIEELPEIPKKPEDSIKDKEKPLSKSSESRSDKAEKSKKASDNNKEESKGEKDDKKDETTKGKEKDDGKNEGTNGKKGDGKNAAEQKKILAEEEVSEDLGKAHFMTDEGKVEETDLGEVKVESEKEALRDADAEATEDMESPKLTDKEEPKYLGTAYIKTDEGKVEEVNIIEVEDESEEGALPDDIEPTKDIESDDTDDLGSVCVLTDKGTLEKINLGKDKKEVEREDPGKSIEETSPTDLKRTEEMTDKDVNESGSAHFLTDKGTVEKIDLEKAKEESEKESLRDPNDLEPTEETEEDLGSAHVLTDTGTVEKIDLGKAKDEAERKDFGKSTEKGSPTNLKPEEEMADKVVEESGSAYILTDKGNIEKIDLGKAKEESEKEGLRDSSDIEPTEETEEDLGSAHVLTDTGTVEKVDLGKVRDEAEGKDFRKSTEKASIPKERESRQRSEDDDEEEQSVTETTSKKIRERGSVEEIVLEEGSISPSKKLQKKWKGSQQTEDESSGDESDKKND